MNSLWILHLSVILTVSCSLRIDQNGYKGVIVSFSEEILEESFDFEKLKNVLKRASEVLFQATRRRSYFEEFILVLPPSLQDDDICDGNATEVPKNVTVYVTNSLDVPTLTAQNSKGCGHRGEVIYLPKDWLIGNTEDLALQFVQQWSVFRYGVFPENPERSGSCIATSDTTWSPVGCYNVDVEAKVRFDANGLPVCYFPEEFSKHEDLLSSIMFSANSSKVLNYCDGSESFPHNPVAPTLHNRICEGDNVWTVIEKSEDFLYGRNLPLEDAKPPKIPKFSCFKETKTQLNIVVQDTDSEARSEIRYALFQFLSIIEPTAFSVNLVTFSNESLTETTNSVELSLQDKDRLKSLLDLHVRLNEKVTNICLACGLRKAYKVSATSEYLPRVIILLARESSLMNAKTSELIGLIQSNTNSILYFVFLDDILNDIIPSSLVNAVQDGGGRIFRVKNDAVFMLTELTIALLDASKNELHLDDKILVIHKKAYIDVKSDITDVFLTPGKTKGSVLYSMQCKKRGDVRIMDNACSDRDKDLQSPICGSEFEISIDEDSGKAWRYAFQYIGGSEGTTCSSLALLKLKSPSKSSFTVKGWLSENKITPGYNTLIIYAEIFGSREQEVRVEARISGPGLDEFRVQLRDNGNGDPDVIKGDNIYSRYFTSFTEKGTYTVSIFAETVVQDWNKTYSEENYNENAMSVSQTKVIGTFRLTTSIPTEDILPPNRVSDLRVISIDNTDRTILLQWTAPGDDYDSGQATKYVTKLSTVWLTLMDFAFNLKENILLETSKPSNSGMIENVTVHCPVSNYNATYYIALQAIDDKNNRGRTSNIIQIYFTDAYFPSNDSIEISTETSTDYNLTTLNSTEVPTNTFTSLDIETTSDESMVVMPTNKTTEGIFIEKNIFIIATSASGAFILLLILINIIICCCCIKKRRSERPKKISKKASLRPPYNINLAYKHGSETSLEENAGGNSLGTLADPSTIYSNSDGSVQDKRYTYHTNRSLKSKMDTQNKTNELGFNLVQAMPAYATSSLSRFAARYRDADDERETSDTRSGDMQLQTLPKNAEETHIYPLGEV